MLPPRLLQRCMAALSKAPVERDDDESKRPSLRLPPILRVVCATFLGWLHLITGLLSLCLGARHALHLALDGYIETRLHPDEARFMSILHLVVAALGVLRIDWSVDQFRTAMIWPVLPQNLYCLWGACSTWTFPLEQSTFQAQSAGFVAMSVITLSHGVWLGGAVYSRELAMAPSAIVRKLFSIQRRDTRKYAEGTHTDQFGVSIGQLTLVFWAIPLVVISAVGLRVAYIPSTSWESLLNKHPGAGFVTGHSLLNWAFINNASIFCLTLIKYKLVSLKSVTLLYCAVIGGLFCRLMYDLQLHVSNGVGWAMLECFSGVGPGAV